MNRWDNDSRLDIISLILKHQGNYWTNHGQVSVASMVYFPYFCMNFLWNSDRRVSLIKCCPWKKVKPILKLIIFGCDIDTKDTSETFLLKMLYLCHCFKLGYNPHNHPGAPNVNFRKLKIPVQKTIWDLEFSEHLL